MLTNDPKYSTIPGMNIYAMRVAIGEGGGVCLHCTIPFPSHKNPVSVSEPHSAGEERESREANCQSQMINSGPL